MSYLPLIQIPNLPVHLIHLLSNWILRIFLPNTPWLGELINKEAFDCRDKKFNNIMILFNKYGFGMKFYSEVVFL